MRELAGQFGTPVYVYDAAKIIERIGDLKAFDVVRYAQKACSNIAILDLVRRQGVLVDAVSAGEIRRAIAAGYPTHGNSTAGDSSRTSVTTEEDSPRRSVVTTLLHPIVYTSDIFDRESLDAVAEYDLHVNCGSTDMLNQLADRMGGRKITLRINPGFGHGHSQKTNTGGEHSKHGIWHEELPDCAARARRLGHTITGLHIHIGSGTDLDHLATCSGAMEKMALTVGETLTTISAGGGLPVPYREGQTYVDLEKYFQLWDRSRKNLQRQLGRPVRLELEPGRYLVAESGYLVAEVRAVKRQGNNHFLLLDAGFNNLARPILYGAYHPMSVCPASGKAEQREPRATVVGGPLCESGDIFTQEEGGIVIQRQLPSANVGDYIVIEVAGAYGFVMSSNYNSKPLSAEVLLQDGKAHLIRQRQTFGDLIRGEAIPPATTNDY